MAWPTQSLFRGSLVTRWCNGLVSIVKCTTNSGIYGLPGLVISVVKFLVITTSVEIVNPWVNHCNSECLKCVAATKIPKCLYFIIHGLRYTIFNYLYDIWKVNTLNKVSEDLLTYAEVICTWEAPFVE
jgi:hypothetical protein